MVMESANQALRQIRTLYALGSVGGLTDAQLVDRFLGRDGPDREEAFTALVERHGPMVLGVCRRMLSGTADAEDAFQAVFLILAKKAGSIRRVEGLRSWIYGVAVRTAMEARRRSARRRSREGGAMDESRAVAAPVEGRGDLLALLDEELARLPGRYRDPLMLCELEGMSRREAATRLGLPEGTLSSRLSRGRSLLRHRLTRRGVALGTGLIASSLNEPANAALPAPLADATVRIALSFAAGGAKTIPIAVAALATTSAPRGIAPAAALAGGVLVATLAVWAVASGGADPMEPPPATPAADPAPIANFAPEETLPDGAILRFGSSRFRHTTSIQALAVSNDGKVAVAASGTRRNGTVRAYDLATGKVLFPFDESLRDVEAIAISPDGKTLAATTVGVNTNAAVYVYGMADGKAKARIAYPPANPGSVSDLILFTPGGTQLVIKAASGKALHLIDLAKGEVIRTFPNAATVFAAALSPDGKRLFVGGFDFETGEHVGRQFEVETGRELVPLPATRGTIRSLAFSPDGATLALGIEARTSSVKLVDAADGAGRKEIPLPEATSIRSLAFSPDGKTLAVSGNPDTLLIDTATGEARHKIDRGAIGLRFAPDGATFVGAVAGTIERWDAGTGRSLTPAGGESPVHQIAVTADGKRVISLGNDGDGHVWDAKTAEHLRGIKMGWQRGFALSPDGRFLVFPEVDRSIEFPDPVFRGATRNGCRLRLFDLAAGALVDRFEAFEGDAHDLFFLDDGKTLATLEHYRFDAEVRLWDVATGKVARTFPAVGGPEDQTWRSRLSPDGKILAVFYQHVSRTGRLGGLGERAQFLVKLWDLATGKAVDGPSPPWFTPEVLAFATDGKTFAATDPNGRTVQFRDTATGAVRGQLQGPRERVTAVGIGPDGRVFTGSLDATILSWDPKAGNLPPADRE